MSCGTREGTPSYSGNPSATTDIDDAPKPGGAAPEIGADEVGCMVTVSGWQDLFEICAGDTARLNSLVIELPECPTTPDRIWTDDGAAPQVRDVSPTTDTTYEVTVTCPSMPDCVVRRTVLVDVDQPPDPFRASSRDVAPCNKGIIVTWDAAIFHGPGGAGTYSVHRSQVSCADALARPPLATGLLDIEWVDMTAVPGTPYFYVIVAEDDDAPTTCLPGGPNNGGATTTSCISLAAVDEVDNTPPADPGPAVMRARHVGQQITMLWPTSRALLADEHFHLVKTYGRPVGGWTLANPELDTTLAFTETDTSFWLQCFLLRVANACETTSAP